MVAHDRPADDRLVVGQAVAERHQVRAAQALSRMLKSSSRQVRWLRSVFLVGRRSGREGGVGVRQAGLEITDDRAEKARREKPRPEGTGRILTDGRQPSQGDPGWRGQMAKLPADLLAADLRPVRRGQSSCLSGTRGGTQSVRAHMRDACSLPAARAAATAAGALTRTRHSGDGNQTPSSAWRSSPREVAPLADRDRAFGQARRERTASPPQAFGRLSASSRVPERLGQEPARRPTRYDGQFSR